MRSYWNIAPRGRAICLNCPLPECDEEHPECGYQNIETSFQATTTNERLSRLKFLVDSGESKVLTLLEICEKADISRGTLARLRDAGHVRVNKYTNQQGKYVAEVNFIGDEHV